jgi:hypothetical protein
LSGPIGAPDEIGEVRGALRRSLRGLISAGILIGGIFGALVALAYLRSGLAAAGSAFLVVFLAGITLVIFLRQPRRVLLGEKGIFLAPYLGSARIVRWEQVTEAKLWRAPLGRQPLVVRLSTEEGSPISLSEAEYHGVSELIEVVQQQLGERFVDESI